MKHDHDAIARRLERLPAEAWDLPDPPPLALPLEEPVPRRLRFRLAVAACAVGLVLLGAVIGVMLDDGGDAPGPGGPEVQIALAPLGDAGSAAGTVDVPRADGTSLTLRVSGLEPAGSGRFYELWLLGADGELIALGSFDVGADGTARASLPLPVDPSRFQYFDLSLEPADGDPGHSGRSVLRGPTSS